MFFRRRKNDIEGDTLEELLESANLGDRFEALADEELPAIWLQSESAPDEAIPVGASKLGGNPDLPDGTPYPQFDGRPLLFLAQIRLADAMGLVGADALPADGLLLFFYDQDQPWGYSPEDSDRFRVMLVDDFGLRGVAPPGNVARLPSCKLSLAQKTTIPDILSMEVEELVLSNVESDDYVEMSEAYAKRFPGPEHQMLGHPVLVQGDMRLEVALVAAGYDCGDGSAFQSEAAQELVHEVTAWKLLLQLDSDDDAGMMWGDAGLLYFWIHEDDLAQRDFTRVRVVLQCT